MKQDEYCVRCGCWHQFGEHPTDDFDDVKEKLDLAIEFVELIADRNCYFCSDEAKVLLDKIK